MATAFGARLRQFREAKGLTLQQVADAVGCTKAYIWELEKREGQRPTAERLNAIAKTLGVTLPDLLGESAEGVTQATPEDVVFFRNYVGLSDEDKERYQQAMQLMFPGSDKDQKKRS